MKKVYLDNAATTSLRPEVVHEMTKVLMENYGNPSSSHSYGRHAKSILELSRKSIAQHLNASAQEIIFTSGGTEANNWILISAVRDLKIQRIITSKIEHHAVLHTIEFLQKEYGIQVDYVSVFPNGEINLTHLVELLSSKASTLVSLMHVNNEIGTVLNLESTSAICKEHQAYFHTDAVQSVGKTVIDLQKIPIDFLASSAHKFHGPKGIGFAVIRKGISLNPIIFGGSQEKGLRAGTESIHNIVGMTKALDLSYQNLENEKKQILILKDYCIQKLQMTFPELKRNGESSFYTILNVMLPLPEHKTPLLLFHLDIKGIAVSRGSACQSGSSKPSHVLAEIQTPNEILKPSLRISFSHTNKVDDIDILVEALKNI